MNYSCVRCCSATNKHTHPCLHCWSAPKKHTPMSPLLTNTQQAHTRVSSADCSQHPHNTHYISMDDHYPPNTHSISIADQHPPNTHAISISDQHPPNTDPCLHCWPACTQQAPMSPFLANTPMSPLLANTHPASTRVSISGQQAPTKATAVLLPALGCPRVVPRNSVSYKVVVAAGVSLL